MHFQDFEMMLGGDNWLSSEVDLKVRTLYMPGVMWLAVWGRSAAARMAQEFDMDISRVLPAMLFFEVRCLEPMRGFRWESTDQCRNIVIHRPKKYDWIIKCNYIADNSVWQAYITSGEHGKLLYMVLLCWAQTCWPVSVTLQLHDLNSCEALNSSSNWAKLSHKYIWALVVWLMLGILIWFCHPLTGIIIWDQW